MPRHARPGMTQQPRGSSAKGADFRLDSLFSSLGRIEIVLLVGGVLLLLVLMYTIQSILSPFLALGSILFIVYPLRRYVLARNVMWLAVILFTLWFLHSISTILAPFVVSLIFAYMLNPVVDLFQGWKVPRWVTSLILILLFLAGISLIIFLILPVAFAQFEGVLDTLSKLIGDFRGLLWNNHVISMLERYGISTEEIRNTLANQLSPRFEDILKGLLKVMLTLMSSISSVVTQLLYVIMVPFLTFYILTDFPKISHRFRMLFPKRMRDDVGEYMTRADELIGRYLRGAITVAVLQGIAISILFSLIGVKYSLLLGLLGSILDLVPYFGLILMMGLSLVIAAFSDPPALPKVVMALGSIGFLHVAEVVFLSPRIVGGRVGLHPLLIILSLLIFMYFLGFVGLLIAVPTTALVILFVREWENRRRGIVTQRSP